jgi:hypothetical protein
MHTPLCVPRYPFRTGTMAAGRGASTPARDDGRLRRGDARTPPMIRLIPSDPTRYPPCLQRHTRLILASATDGRQHPTAPMSESMAAPPLHGNSENVVDREQSCRVW